MTDDIRTGYATANVTPLAPEDQAQLTAILDDWRPEPMPRVHPVDAISPDRLAQMRRAEGCE